MQFDLSPQAAHRIAYVASNTVGGNNATVQYKVWDTSSGSVTLGPANTIFTTSRSIGGLDFSPDGGRLAFGSSEYYESKLDVYDFSNPAAGAVTILSGWRVLHVRWRADGQAIYFTGYRAGTNDPIKVYEVAADGSGVPTPLFDVATGTNPVFDASRPSVIGFDKVLIDYRPISSGPVYLRAYNRDGSYLQLGEGSDGHYNCSNDRIIYTEYAVRKPRTLIGNADLTFSSVWSTDSNIRRTDWMPC